MKRKIGKGTLAGKLPTLVDLVKTIPKGGLLNPGLRKSKPFNPKSLAKAVLKNK